MALPHDLEHLRCCFCFLILRETEFLDDHRFGILRDSVWETELGGPGKASGRHSASELIPKELQGFKSAKMEE